MWLAGIKQDMSRDEIKDIVYLYLRQAITEAIKKFKKQNPRFKEHHANAFCICAVYEPDTNNLIIDVSFKEDLDMCTIYFCIDDERDAESLEAIRCLYNLNERGLAEVDDISSLLYKSGWIDKK